MFLPIILSMCFGCPKEPSHRDGSFEYPQHMFWLRNKKLFLLRTINLSPALCLVHTISVSPSPKKGMVQFPGKGHFKRVTTG